MGRMFELPSGIEVWRMVPGTLHDDPTGAARYGKRIPHATIAGCTQIVTLALDELSFIDACAVIDDAHAVRCTSYKCLLDATTVVHWPGRTCRFCDACTARAHNIAGHMGFLLTIEPLDATGRHQAPSPASPPQVECQTDSVSAPIPSDNTAKPLLSGRLDLNQRPPVPQLDDKPGRASGGSEGK